MAVCQVCETTLCYRGVPASGGYWIHSWNRRSTPSLRNMSKRCAWMSGSPWIHVPPFPMYHIGVDTVLKVLSVRYSARVHHGRRDVTLDETSGRSRLTWLQKHFACERRVYCDMTRPAMTRVPLESSR